MISLKDLLEVALDEKRKKKRKKKKKYGQVHMHQEH